MASGVRYTKPEREVVTAALEQYIRDKVPGVGLAARLRAAESALHKMELSELAGPKKKGEPGIGWNAAASAMREVLGDRLALPPAPTGEWCGRMSSRIRDWGLGLEECRKIAKAASTWKGAVSFESLIYKSLQLLSDSNVVPAAPAKPRAGGPMGMGEL